MSDDLPELRTIQHPRHPGVSAGVCEAFSEAAEACMYRYHQPPSTSFAVECCGTPSQRALLWQQPSETVEKAWNNKDDATRDGAYIISLAAVENELGFVALSRAETRTGADYYIGTASSLDLEDAFRLEVSGVDHGDRNYIKQRLRDKEKQAADGDSFLPAYASVVGFKETTILISFVENS